MTIIFLDIDGVLNSNLWYYKRMSQNIEKDYPLSEFDPDAIKRLNKILLETGAKIVVSSSWRSGHTNETMQKLLTDVGVIGEVVGLTPSFRGMITDYTTPRGCEIDWWLKKEGLFQRINWSEEKQMEFIEKAKVKNYIILDDDSDMLYKQREHFVKTDNMVGLTDEDVDKSIMILKKNLVDLYYENKTDNLS